jgi:hypothetical protein
VREAFAPEALSEEFSSGRTLECWIPHERLRALPSACGKSHFVTPQTALLPRVYMRVNPFVTEPSIPVLVLKIFDGAGWHMTVKIGVVFYLYVFMFFHGNLLFSERLE